MSYVILPHLGVSVTEATLTTWLKDVGDEIAVGEPICEVSTDKVDTQIESTVAGVLTEQRFAEDDVVPVGEVLAVVAGLGEETNPESTAPAVQEIVIEPPASEAAEPVAGPEPGTAPTPGPRADVVAMPHLGVSVTEGTLTTWLKDVGEEIAVGEPICEVSTDKVDTQIESTVAGVLAEQRFAEGDVVPVGEALAVVTADGSVPDPTAARIADGPALAAPVGEPGRGLAPSPSTAVAPSGTSDVSSGPANVSSGPFDHEAAISQLLAGIARGNRPAASPLARRTAAELGVEIAAVAGTGGGGRITPDDVSRRAASAQITSLPVKAPEVSPSPKNDSEIPAGYEDVPFEAVPTSRIRQATAEHMTRSRRTSAHMTTEVDVDLGRLTDVRAALNAQRQGAGQPKLSFLPFIARAACAALLDHPDLNATFQNERLLRWREINLGIAVDTPRGLMVPVIRGAQRLTVEALGQSIVDAAARVRDRKAGADDYRAGTFTISNPGSVGAVSAPAIINQPQVGILGMPTIVRRPWAVRLADGQETIAIRPIIRLALTFDHRAVDGADATRCLVDVRRRLQAWGVDDYR
ncbi:catalytic domain of component of various dehydrogenase complexes [Parafrankia sp. EUN1f]|nr:catalytic domain of component of various dehydrogenase complexes [Parafrankia sp. EUN1f]